MYMITGFLKSSEQDDYNEGCIDGVTQYYIDHIIRSDTIDGLKQQIASFVGCDVGDLESDACDEIGRIDASRTETVNGDEPTKFELEEWKRGKETLYYANYTAIVMECNPVSVSKSKGE